MAKDASFQLTVSQSQSIVQGPAIISGSQIAALPAPGLWMVLDPPCLHAFCVPGTRTCARRHVLEVPPLLQLSTADAAGWLPDLGGAVGSAALAGVDEGPAASLLVGGNVAPVAFGVVVVQLLADVDGSAAKQRRKKPASS